MTTVGLSRLDWMGMTTGVRPLDPVPLVAVPDTVQAALRSRQSVRAQRAEAQEQHDAATKALQAALAADQQARVARILTGEEQASDTQVTATETLLATKVALEDHELALDSAEWSLLLAVNGSITSGAWLKGLEREHGRALRAVQQQQDALTAATSRLRTAAAALLWARLWAEGKPTPAPPSVPGVTPPDIPDALLNPRPTGRQSTHAHVAVGPDGNRYTLGDVEMAKQRLDDEAEAHDARGAALAQWQQNGRTS